MQDIDYTKEKSKRKWKYQKEKEDLERNLLGYLKQQELTNYLLAVIAMILVGIFLAIVVGGISG